MKRCPECKYKLPDGHIVTCGNCLTKVRTADRKILQPTRSFHHPDSYMRESTVREIEVSNNLSPLYRLKVECGLCKGNVDSITSTQGSLLGMSTRTERYTEIDLVSGLDVEFTKQVKFPTYRKVHICLDCVNDFTLMCNQYDDFNNVKAKLQYIPTTVSRESDDIISPIATSVEYMDLRERIIQEDSVTEITDIKRVQRLGMKFHPITDPGVDTPSPQELSAKKSKVARLKPPTGNVNPK